MPIYTRRPNVRTGRRILRFVQRVFGPRRPAPIWAAWLCTFLILPSLAMAAISERKREPVVVKATTDKFPSWVDNGTPAAGLELWVFKNGSWTPVPYQVDEVSRNVQDVKPFIDPAQFSGAQCQGGASGT